MSLLPIIDSGSEPAASQPSDSCTRGRYAFVSLGCPKNLVDSEKMLGQLALDGYQLVPDPDGADFVIVNTCGFIESSRDESRSVVQEMLDLKASGRTGGVIVAGCLPQRLKESGGLLQEIFPDVNEDVL